jgi:hypothetical protein
MRALMSSVLVLFSLALELGDLLADLREFGAHLLVVICHLRHLLGIELLDVIERLRRCGLLLARHGLLGWDLNEAGDSGKQLAPPAPNPGQIGPGAGSSAVAREVISPSPRPALYRLYWRMRDGVCC